MRLTNGFSALTLYFALFGVGTFALANPNDDPSALVSADQTPTAPVDELIDSAQQLFINGNPVDARTQLQKALLAYPNDYRPHMLLGTYYLSEVGHFTLAYRYILKAEELFTKAHGSNPRALKNPELWRQHARLLYLRAEAELNLDHYSDSLKTLDRFASQYWDDWYPGTRAWVLMKLRRLDEAITVAQSGLLHGAEPGRTYNILGILLSMKENRELSLEAFSRAIRAEYLQGSLGQVATPLNNAGEVYRELFRDDFAEAAWLKSLQLPDGCEHILPSLNLTMLYIDQLRLLQAERVLNDFEACYATHGLRSDTEHRALLALARGKIALRRGFVDQAIELFTQAGEREQWFGKIGTNQNDVRLASLTGRADAFMSKSALLELEAFPNLISRFQAFLERQMFRSRAYWLYRQARLLAVEEMDDFEDLSLRNTDTMLEYPSLGSFLSTFSELSIQRRLKRLMRDDQRPMARVHYQLFEDQVQIANGDVPELQKSLEQVLKNLRPIDRLARARTLELLCRLERDAESWWSTPTSAARPQYFDRRQQLFELSPSSLPYNSLRLPAILVTESREDADTLAVVEMLQGSFEFFSSMATPTPRYRLEISRNTLETEPPVFVATFYDNYTQRVISTTRRNFDSKSSDSALADFANQVMQDVFQHRSDPASPAIPTLDLLKGIMEQ